MYTLPPAAIAQRPVHPRDAAKLLLYDPVRHKTSDHVFSDLPSLLPSRSVIVMNNTKVIPARLTAIRASGGKVEVFVLAQRGRRLTALLNRPVQPGERLQVGKYILHLLERGSGQAIFATSWPSAQLDTVLQKYGKTPLPPYLKRSPLSESARRREYQSFVAEKPGSVAAPTASLHFTPRLLRRLKSAGHDVVLVTLHVGLGTFAPLTPLQLKTGRLHSETFEVSAQTARRIVQAKKAGRPVIAVGTTVARALESSTRRGQVIAKRGKTDIFIRPGYRWRIVDGLITNFHVPNSSLILLVASMIGLASVRRLYQHALRRSYRFLSFGDGMFIRPVLH